MKIMEDNLILLEKRNPDGSITIQSQLSGTQTVKAYGELLDRDRKQIEHLES